MPDDDPNDRPPDLDGPDEQPQVREASATTSRPLFPAAPKSPVGASPVLEYIMSAVADQRLRDEIEQAAWSLRDGNDEHLLTRAAALFSAIEQAHLSRSAVLFTEHRRLLSDMAAILADLDATLEAHEVAGQQEPSEGEGERPAVQRRAGVDAETLVEALRPVLQMEVKRAVQTAYRANLTNIYIFGGAGVLVGLALAWLIHVL